MYRYRALLQNGVDMYMSYKYLIDPENRHGHIYTMFKLSALIVNIGVCMIQLYMGMGSFGPSTTNNEMDKTEKFLKITFRSGCGKTYFYLVRVPVNTNPIKQILNEDDDDITDEVLPYLSSSMTTPADFGYKRITVQTVFEQEVIFEENELMNIDYFSD